jgi:hypothetical protein
VGHGDEEHDETGTGDRIPESARDLAHALVAARARVDALRAVRRGDRVNERDDRFLSVEGRLTDAALSGETVEVILVLRGKVTQARTPGRWRIRATGQRTLTFSAEAVVAATPAAGDRRSKRA